VPKAKARSAAAGFVCYAALLAAPACLLPLTCRGSSEIAMQKHSRRGIESMLGTQEADVSLTLSNSSALWSRVIAQRYRSSGIAARASPRVVTAQRLRGCRRAESESGVTRLKRALQLLTDRAHRFCEPAAARLKRAKACVRTPYSKQYHNVYADQQRDSAALRQLSCYVTCVVARRDNPWFDP
jgi:hypothetical protein